MAEQLVRKEMETVLVVDDVDRVLSVAVKILKDANYNVLLAESGANAIDLAANYAGSIDLLLSDVQMPGMTGPDLGKALKKARPELRIMFMSGFTGGNLLVLNLWLVLHQEIVRAEKVAPNGKGRSRCAQQVSGNAAVRYT